MRHLAAAEYSPALRKVREAGGAFFFTALPGIVLLFLAMGCMFKAAKLLDEEKAWRTGPSALGKVVARHEFPREGQTEVVAEFREGGRVYAARSSMSSKEAEGYRIGKRAMALYPEGKPERAVLAGFPPPSGKRESRGWMGLSNLAMLLAGAVICCTKVLEKGQRRRLEDGTPSDARVTERVRISPIKERVTVVGEEGAVTFATFPSFFRALQPGAPATLLRGPKGLLSVAESLWAVDLVD